MGDYDDILHLQRPVSRKHPPMRREDRAKQFMPYASLRGFDAVIRRQDGVHEAASQPVYTDEEIWAEEDPDDGSQWD